MAYPIESLAAATARPTPENAHPTLPYSEGITNAIDAALRYAVRGWKVLPLHGVVDGRCSCGRPDCTSAGKHPLTAHGVQDATTDPDVIRAWWRRWPMANVGIATGPESGLLVLDLDGPAGATTVAALAKYGFRLPDSAPQVRTGSGGTHVYLRWPGDTQIPGTVRLLPGLDVRAAGNYVVAPPSLHESGHRYEWLISPSAELPECPAWLSLMSDLLRRAGVPRKLQALGRISKGSRNDSLTSLAGAMRRVGMESRLLGAVLAAVNLAMCDPPLPDPEAETIVRSVGRYSPAAATCDETRPTYHLTDLGNAQRLVARHGADLRYCHPWGKWLVWDGARWAADTTGEVLRRAKETARSIYEEAAAEADPDRRKALARHALASESAARVQGMVTLAASEPGIPVLPEELDRDPWLLNVQNGTLDLRTGELRPHRREDLLTKLAPVTYDPAAQCPRWERFLLEIMGGNRELVEFLKRAAGLSLTGVVSEHVLFILHGTGRNGKSTLLNTLQTMLGDYALTTPPDLLMAKFGERHPTELTDLYGRRLAIAVESDDGRRLAEALVKQLTGGDPIRARRMREDFWQFMPTHHLWLATNHRPRVHGTDPAIWSRIRLIPFDVSFRGREDKQLPDKLRNELPGILAWAVQGCLAWQREGLGLPAAVARATSEYQAEQDVLITFLNERCTASQQNKVGVGDLYKAYVGWCNETGEHALSQRELGKRLEERGYQRKRGAKGRWYWLGIGLVYQDKGDAGDVSDVNPPIPSRRGSYKALIPENASPTSPMSPTTEQPFGYDFDAPPF